MRSDLSLEVPVNRTMLTRLMVAAAVLAGSFALAQPANDACTAAELLNVSNTAVTSTTATGLNLATPALESTMACGGTPKNSVWYQFTAPRAGTYRIETCGAVTNFDTVLQVYTGTCGSLTQTGSGCSDDGTSCSPSSASAATITATAGTTYFVQVAAYSTVTLSASSQLNLTVTPPPPPPANDTCAAAEPLTPAGLTPVVSSVARSFSATAAVEEPFACLTNPTSANRSVWYSVTPTVSGNYRLETCSATAPGNTVSDTVLAVYTGACGALTPSAATCNNDACSSRSGVSMTMTAGQTYFVQLAINGTTAPSLTTDSLQLSVAQILNSPADLCSTAPSLPLNRTVPVFTTADAGYSLAQNNAELDGGASCFTGLGQTTSMAVGRDLAYQFTAPTTGRYSFRLGTPTSSVNGVLYLTNTCVAVNNGIEVNNYTSSQCLAASNRNTSADEQLSCVPLGQGDTVYAWFDETTLSTAGSAATLEATPCIAEEEPNNTPTAANALSCVMTGAISTAGEADFYALGAHPAGTRVFAMAEGAASSSADFDLRITTETRTIEYDDGDLTTPFGSTAPVIAGALLGTEPAYVRVNHFSSTTTAEPYVLYTHVQREAPTAEAEPNDTFATASTSANNFFTGSITDGGTDVDFYAFTANQGDLIFAALETTPDKADAGPGSFNFVMSLVDATGTLLTVDDTNTSISRTANTSLTATSPTAPGEGLVYRARATGTYAVRVGKTSGANPNPYNLSVSVGCTDLAPTLSAVTPSSGTPSGGQTVTLTGTGFSSRSVVRFGTGVALVNSISPTELIVTTPAGSSGDVAVSVTNGVGLSASLNPGYTYDDPPGLPPVIASLTPTFGPVTGGTVVTITGSVFRRDAGVFFDVGGTQVGAAAVTVNNATRITATTPAMPEGFSNVTVANYDGLTATLDGGFEFRGPPSVSAITPNAGLTTGGLTITLTGRNFRAGTTVRVGANLATAVTPAGDGLSLTAVTPTSATNGAVDVVVTTTDGQTTTVTQGFTFSYPAPLLVSVTPGSGYEVGGTSITLRGSNFRTAPTVSVGGVAATGVTFTSATEVSATTPAGTGVVDVTLTNADGQTTTLAQSFRYVPAPTLAAVSPSHGPVQGGTRITITGTNFQRGASVFVGGVPAFAVDVSSPTTATAVTNAARAGAADVRLVNPDAQAATLAGAYTYDPGPTIASLSPISGSTGGGTTITITGTGFLTGAQVLFGTDAATSVTVNSPTELTAVTPARPVGVVSVVVRNADNQSAELPRAYRFVAPPTLTAVAPTSGDVNGGTVVRLTGTGFNAGSTVSFGGTPSTQVTLVSATELDALTPAHMPGAVDVVVTTDGASATLAGAFTYTRSAPTLTAVAPVSGPTTGGTLLTLTGTGFAPGATVTIGGTAATNVIIVAPELARVVIPAHAAGTVDVVLTNDDTQSATLTSGFTYAAPPSGNTGLVDAGSGAVGADPQPVNNVPGGVSCGCTSFDGSTFSLGAMGLLIVLSRRRRR